VRAIVGRTGEIELRLNADLHAFGLPLALGQARARRLGLRLRSLAFASLGFRGSLCESGSFSRFSRVCDGGASGVFPPRNLRLVKWQAGLRIITAEVPAACAVLLQSARNFVAPVRLFRFFAS